MPPTLEGFVRSISDAGLMDAEEVRAFIDELPDSKRPDSAEDLARELVRAGRLTKFQAQLVYQGKAKGLVIGNYIIQDKLGEGGMGQVYRARHKRMDRSVALKILPVAATKSADAVQRFQREVKAVARLAHPNIVTAFDADEERGLHFLAMEHIDGQDLGKIVKQQGALSIPVAMDYLLQAAQGLQYAHEQGVVHRDIKPSNLLVDRRGIVKVLDMGLARIVNTVSVTDGGLTHTGQVMGTIDYMAPEQALDTKHADARSDIYSLGCTLYYLLTGRVVFPEDTVVKKILAHTQRPAPSPRAVRPEIPEAVEKLCHRMLAKNPDDRPQTMAEVIVALDACRLASAGIRVTESSAAVDNPIVSTESPRAGKAESPGSDTAHLRRAEVATSSAEIAAESFDPTIIREPVVLPWLKSRGGPRYLQFLFKLHRRQKVGLAILVGVLGVTLASVLVISIVPREETPRGEGTDAVPTLARQTAGGTKGTEMPPTPAQKSTGQDAPLPAIAPFDEKKAKEHQAAWARYLGVPVEMTNSIGMKFVLIPPGEFDMGSPSELVEQEKQDRAGDPPWMTGTFIGEGPQHRVRITAPFWLGEFEVTQDEYHRVVGANPSEFSATGTAKDKVAGRDTRRFPVETVRWHEAVEFCQRLSVQPGEVAAERRYTLPTAAQWEYACRAGTVTRWHFGDNAGQLTEYGWFAYNAEGTPHPVGQRKENPWGLYDLHGNVWELCADWYDGSYYAQSPMNDPVGPTGGQLRVGRGGSWQHPAAYCRTAFNHVTDGTPYGHCGFRVACKLAGVSHQRAPEGELDGYSPDGWNRAVNLGPAVNSGQDDGGCAVSADGLTLLFTSNRPGGLGDFDLWTCRRPLPDAAFGEPTNLGPEVNSSTYDANPTVTADGLMLVFESLRSGDQDLWTCTRASPAEPFPAPINLGPAVNSTAGDWTPALSSDGLTLVFGSNRPGGHGLGDLWLCRRGSRSDPFGNPINLGPTVNSSEDDAGPDLSANGLRLIFASKRPGGEGGVDLWMATRTSIDAPFGRPTNLGPPINTSGLEANPILSVGDRTLLFDSDRPGGRDGVDLWMSTRIPTAAVSLPKGEGSSLAKLRVAVPPQAVAPFDATSARKHQAAWAKYLGQPVEMTNSIGMKLAIIPSGEFLMGSSESEQSRRADEYQHHVRITKPFYLGVHEVTQAQFERVTVTNPSNFKASGGDLPVENISWEDAGQFCHKLSELPEEKAAGRVYRLPTEAEWEHACRAGTTTPFHFGTQLNGREANCNGTVPYGTETVGPNLGRTTTVGCYAPNAFGLHDMHGNVWEWCQDWHHNDYYQGSPTVDPQGPPTAWDRVTRGGCFDSLAGHCRAAHRGWSKPALPRIHLGFRVALVPPGR